MPKQTKLNKNQLPAGSSFGVVVDLAPSDILDWYNNPITILASQGVNKIILPTQILGVAYTTGKTPYINGTNIVFTHGGNEGFGSNAMIMDGNWLTSADSAIEAAEISFSSLAAVADVINQPIIARPTDSTLFEDGNAHAQIFFYYNLQEVTIP